MSLKCVMYHGDCLDVIPRAPKADLAIADLPFGASKYPWDVPICLRRFWKALNGMPTLAFANWKFAQCLMHSNSQNFRYELVWDLMQGRTPLLAKRMPMRAHQFVLIFARHSAQYTPQKTTGHPRVYSSDGMSKDLFYGRDKTLGYVYDSTERHPTSVLRIPPDKRARNNKTGDRKFSRTHPSAKPVSLLKWLILSYSKPESTVLDPTAGCASSALAALSVGRNVVCIEKNDEYFGLALDRVRKECHEKNWRATVEVRR